MTENDDRIEVPPGTSVISIMMITADGGRHVRMWMFESDSVEKNVVEPLVTHLGPPHTETLISLDDADCVYEAAHTQTNLLVLDREEEEEGT